MSVPRVCVLAWFLCRHVLPVGVWVFNVSLLDWPSPVPLEGSWAPHSHPLPGKRAASCSAVKFITTRGRAAGLCLARGPGGCRIHFAFLTLLGATTAWRVALPVLSPPSVLWLGHASHPAWGGALGSCLCFWPLSSGSHCHSIIPAVLTSWPEGETATDGALGCSVEGKSPGAHTVRTGGEVSGRRRGSRSGSCLDGATPDPEPPLSAEMSVTTPGAKLEGARWPQTGPNLFSSLGGRGRARGCLSCISGPLKGLGQGQRGGRAGAALDALCFPLCALCVSGPCPGLHK